jgi:5-deoxy-glucuronate isomerase
MSAGTEPAGQRGEASPAHHLKAERPGGPVAVSVPGAGWRFLDFAVHRLGAGRSIGLDHPGRELAVVPIEGTMTIRAGDERFSLVRRDVFSEPPHVVYCAPGDAVTVHAASESLVAAGSAPAEGRYPTRLFAPEEMRAEMRGGGAALRQVHHILAAPLPAERLILYEIVAPRGTWCGWPPHCHDGFDGSPYLEETYYFRFDRPEGYAIHHNYRPGGAFDELFTPGDGDLVLVTQGYHTTVASPGSHMYFLNYLAGEPTDDERARPPCFDGRHTWITRDWDAGSLTLPTPGVTPS